MQLLQKLVKQSDIDIKKYPVRNYQEKLNRFKDSMIEFWKLKEEDEAFTLPKEFMILREYEKLKKNSNALDFADLIFKPVELLKSDLPISNYLKNRYKYILVDEFQDTNAVQYELLKLLSSGHDNLCVVGDDDQSIYSWRGAVVDNILNFSENFHGTTVVKLEKNYRSCKPILEVSNAIVKNNKKRAEKNLKSMRNTGIKPFLKKLENEYKEAEFVVKKIEEMIFEQKYDYNDFAVFYRTNNQSRVIEEKFRAADIPYLVFGTISFYSRKEIKDLIAYLKFIVNPDDRVSFLRIINEPKRGIGKTSIDKIEAIANQNNISLYEVIKNSDKYSDLSAGLKKKLLSFFNMIEKYVLRVPNEPVSELLKELVDEIEYRELFQNSIDIKEQSRVYNIDEFINSTFDFCKKEEKNTTRDFLEKITLYSETDKIDETKNYVSLMTYHCAKGLEFPIVFMVGLEEDILPHFNSKSDSEQLEEERRLCYVGITRAKDFLYLLHTGRRTKFGEHSYPKVSRFIKEAFPDYEIQEQKYDSEPNFLKSYFKKPGFKKSNFSFDKITKEKKQSDFFVKKGMKDFKSRLDKDSSGFDTSFTVKKELSPGAKVLHKVFGPGKVISVNFSGDKVEVSFIKAGKKLLSIKYANLRIL
jgi:DNA helicase-2/ATP-dependent DNA helicase PcrA